MKKIISFFILTFFTLISDAQTTIHEQYDTTQFNYVDYHPSGQIKTLGNISDEGIKFGQWFLFDDGFINAPGGGNYKKGKRHGLWIRPNSSWMDKYKKGKLVKSDDGMGRQAWGC